MPKQMCSRVCRRGRSAFGPGYLPVCRCTVSGVQYAAVCQPVAQATVTGAKLLEVNPPIGLAWLVACVQDSQALPSRKRKVTWNGRTFKYNSDYYSARGAGQQVAQALGCPPVGQVQHHRAGMFPVRPCCSRVFRPQPTCPIVDRRGRHGRTLACIMRSARFIQTGKPSTSELVFAPNPLTKHRGNRGERQIQIWLAAPPPCYPRSPAAAGRSSACRR